MAHQKGDVVRIVSVEGAEDSMLRHFLNHEATVLERNPEKPGLYVVEVDVGRVASDRSGLQGGPRFVVKARMLEPEVTPAMIRAAHARLNQIDGDMLSDELVTDIYRTMRGARFQR